MATHGTATKLGIWNNALFEAGDRQLSDTGESVEAARVLTQIYDGVVMDCLAAAAWNFAERVVKLTSDTGVSPNFGPTEIFAKPADWVRTTRVSADDRFTAPVLDFSDEKNFWAAESSPLYFGYVSDSGDYGYDLTLWPRTFTRFVELELADRSLPRLSQATADKERIKKDRDKAKRNAFSKDAMNEANPKFPPTGSWTAARSGGNTSRDRGNTGSLTG